MKEQEHLLSRMSDFNNLSVMADSGWSDAKRVGRCISDFFREITFSRPLDVEEKVKIRQILAEANCPGWTGVNICNINQNTYRFVTTWDSSD